MSGPRRVSPSPSLSLSPSLPGLTILLLAALTLGAATGAAVGQESESSLRQKLAWQVALDRVGFSPGLIDGKIGPKTELATREFQRVRGLPVTGRLDKPTAEALQVDPSSVIGRYTIQKADLDEIGPAPASWVAKSKLRRLGHEALENVIAEKFYCSTGLLATLNPAKSVNGMKAGDQVVVPVVSQPGSYPKAARVEVNLSEKVIRVISRDQKLVALFHCSIAASKSKLPSGDARVVVIAPDPNYTFRPEMWPEVKEKTGGPLNIPPGPRNPVGRCWIGLSLPGYGMHGTPNPELIGKTGSHGCFRLTNWDAIRLSKMVTEGTLVRFTDHPEGQLASTRR